MNTSTKTQSPLNKFATETLQKNELLFLVGACRLFVLWAKYCVLSHLKTERDSDGEIISWESCPRYLPYSEMLKVFPNLKEWAKCEQTVLEEIECAVCVFAGEDSEPRSKAEAKADIDELEPDGWWQDAVTLFFESLLQSLLMANGWSKNEVSGWCNQEDDAPDYEALFEKLSSITPEQAIEISKSANLEEFMPDSPPFCRFHGWMPAMPL